MAKKYIYLQGKLSWVKHLKPDDRFGDPKWSVKLHPNAESLTVIKELVAKKGEVDGVMNKLQKDDDGYFMTFSRHTSRIYQGKTIAFLPPVILNKDGSPLVNTAIGNGSDGTIKLEYYTFKRKGGPGQGSAVRWESLRLDHLIPYEASKDLVPEEYKLVKDLVEQPAQLF